MMLTWQEQRTHCKNGHEFTVENVRWYGKTRFCRACVRANSAKKRLRDHPVRFTRSHRQASLVLYPPIDAAMRRKREVERANQLVVELKSEPCTDCGGCFHYSAMDFDHMPGFEKSDTVSNMSSSGKSWKRILEEAAKCELVCANCHRVRTFNRRQARR